MQKSLTAFLLTVFSCASLMMLLSDINTVGVVAASEYGVLISVLAVGSLVVVYLIAKYGGRD